MLPDMADFSFESLNDADDQAPQQMINNIYCMTKYFKDMTGENRESFVECLLAKVGQLLDMLEVEEVAGSFEKAKKDFIKIILFLSSTVSLRLKTLWPKTMPLRMLRL